MALNGIDISSYQAVLNLDNVTYDFVCIKATEGLDYVNPVCDTHYQQAKAAGKKRAVYHFIDFSQDMTAQADFFVDNCAGYIRDAIFVLDWEGSGVADVSGALTFLRRVEARIGYKPAIYMSEYVENTYAWNAVVNGDYGLWLAKYSDYEIDNNYDMSQAGQPPETRHWDFYFMWQWTSKGHLNGYAGDLDCDIAYLDATAWDKYAGILATNEPAANPADPTPAPSEPPVLVVPPAPQPDDTPPATPPPLPTPAPVDTPVPTPQTPDAPVVGPPVVVVGPVETNNKGEKKMSVKTLVKSVWANDLVRRVFHTFWQAALGVLVAHFVAPAQPTDVKALVVAAVAAGASAAKNAVVTALSK